MQSLARRIEKLLSDSRATAEAACEDTDPSGPFFAPAQFQMLQDGLRAQLLWVEHRIRELRGRASGREQRLAQRYARKPTLKALRKEHTTLLRRRLRVLSAQRCVLRQIGDMHAWMILRQDPRILVPLYAERTQRLPAGIGLAGPAVIAERAHATGKFLVIENDLTRCLGIGDLTVVSASQPWSRPICIEVKTSEDRDDVMAIRLITAYSTGKQEALHDDFCRTLQLVDTAQEDHSREVKRQTEELATRTELLLAATERAHPKLQAFSRRSWQLVANVITRGLIEGVCVDIVERGILVSAIRSVDGRLAAEQEAELKAQLEQLGSPRDYVRLSSFDLLKSDAWSPWVLPIALWPLVPARARVALMTGDLHFACAMRRSVWVDAMKAEGLHVEDDGHGWRLSGPRGAGRFDLIEVQKLMLGVAFGGVSPRQVAKRVAASIGRAKD